MGKENYQIQYYVHDEAVAFTGFNEYFLSVCLSLILKKGDFVYLRTIYLASISTRKSITSSQVLVFLRFMFIKSYLESTWKGLNEHI